MFGKNLFTACFEKNAHFPVLHSRLANVASCSHFQFRVSLVVSYIKRRCQNMFVPDLHKE